MRSDRLCFKSRPETGPATFRFFALQWNPDQQPLMVACIAPKAIEDSMVIARPSASEKYRQLNASRSLKFSGI